MVKLQDTISNDADPRSPDHNAKRKRIIDDSISEPPPYKKKARVRVSFSCGECHRRKQKCDRGQPCGHCVARKVPELCKAYTPGKSDQDLHIRMSRIEHILERALPQYASAFPSVANSDDAREASPSSGIGEHDDDDAGEGRLSSGTWHGISAIGSVSSAPILEQLQSMVPHQRLTSETEIRDSISHLARLSSCSKDLALAAEHLNAARAGDPASLLAATRIINAVRQFAEVNDGSGLNPNGAEGLALPAVLEDTSAAEKFRYLVQDCGVSPHKVSELLQELPPKKHLDALVDFYFESINYTRYPLNEREFRHSYDAVCAVSGIGINPSDIKFLPLLWIVLAIAVRVAPSSLTGGDQQQRLTSLRYYWSSRRSLLFAAAVHNDSVELVWVRLLSARFLTFDRRITESWSQLGAAVRTAQALGLHRDGRKMGLDVIQTQKRRRLWAYVYHADRSFALVMGRPHCIMDDYTSTLPPLNIEDQELLANPTNPPEHPLTTITPMTFVILRHQLASIIGRICHHFQQVRLKTHYSEVLNLDEDLTRFMHSLPPHFALLPDTSLNESHRYVPVHRFLVLTEIMFVRMSLHRPYILRRLDSDRFAKSRRACFDAAKKDFAVRTEFRRSMPPQTLRGMGVAYREFQTAMISGIALMLDPIGPDADDMSDIVDTFLSDHRDIIDLDPTTQRELKIIEFLKSKSQDNHRQSDSTIALSSSSPHETTGDKKPCEDASANLSSQSESPRMSTGPPLSSMRTCLPAVSTHQPQISSPMNGGHFHPMSPSLMTRIQQGEVATDSPPPASGSPGDEANGAQSLLDHWCDTVTNATTRDLYNALPSDSPYPSWSSPLDFSDGLGSVSSLPVGAIGPNPVSLEADLNYWETMFNLLPNAGRNVA